MNDPERTRRRAKRIDRWMGGVISVGGLSIILAVVGILLFIGAEAFPLFRSPRAQAQAPFSATGSHGLFADESGQALMTLDLQGGIRSYSVPASAHPAPTAAGAPPLPWSTATSPTSKGEIAVVGSDGKVYTGRMGWEKAPGEPNPAQWEPTVKWEPGLACQDRIRSILAFRLQASSGLSGGSTFKVAALTAEGPAWGEAPASDGASLVLKPLALPAGEVPTAALWSSDGSQLIVGTTGGRLLVQDIDGTGGTLRQAEFGEGISALGFALGGNSILVGGAKGSLAAYQQVRVDELMTLQRFHDFPPHPGPVQGFMASLRDKRFLSWSGVTLAVDHLTTERRTFQAPCEGLVSAALSPRGDHILAATAAGPVRHWSLDAPHTEVSWSLLWRKTHYEGYPKAETVWQSTGGTDDFEPKFSLVPLLFGTLKGTFYAMLFALPLAIFGALYTSQFAHPSLRNLIKPTVEVMAALPSVVLGFLAGLVLAPMFERSMVQFLVIPPLALLVALVAAPLWSRLPKGFRTTFGEGRESLWMIPLLLLAFLVSFLLAPSVERLLLGGDYRQWLQAKGMIYDQRNSLVVGFAMGFAVIPIIFTISEDALSSVPKSLTSASLACGASPWQTAWRVVLPTASPGIFSAAMVGLGRAVGETMIVLMATGNTPVMDWSPFNGMRTLAANIAVEVPEASHHGTLYRVLFLAALLLFGLTFLLNTLAELVRQHLRKRYESL